MNGTEYLQDNENKTIEQLMAEADQIIKNMILTTKRMVNKLNNKNVSCLTPMKVLTYTPPEYNADGSRYFRNTKKYNAGCLAWMKSIHGPDVLERIEESLRKELINLKQLQS